MKTLALNLNVVLKPELEENYVLSFNIRPRTVYTVELKMVKRGVTYFFIEDDWYPKDDFIITNITYN